MKPATLLVFVSGRKASAPSAENLKSTISSPTAPVNGPTGWCSPSTRRL